MPKKERRLAHMAPWPIAGRMLRYCAKARSKTKKAGNSAFARRFCGSAFSGMPMRSKGGADGGMALGSPALQRFKQSFCDRAKFFGYEPLGPVAGLDARFLEYVCRLGL